MKPRLAVLAAIALLALGLGGLVWADQPVDADRDPASRWSVPVFVTSQQADALRSGGAAVLDTRGERGFGEGHAPGAVRVDWRVFSDPEHLGSLDPDSDRLRQRVEALGVDRERPVVVMGDWQAGWGEEGRIFWMLDSLGHPDVHIVEGGHPAWVAAGLATSRDTTEPIVGSFPLQPVSSALAATAQLGDADTVLLDVRSREEFEGATPYGASRGGHVPGARHLYWRALFDADGALRPVSELEALLPGPRQRVVVYCTGGVRSGFVYAVLRALGRQNVANYAGSWWEYADSDLPVE